MQFFVEKLDCSAGSVKRESAHCRISSLSMTSGWRRRPSHRHDVVIRSIRVPHERDADGGYILTGCLLRSSIPRQLSIGPFCANLFARQLTGRNYSLPKATTPTEISSVVRWAKR